MGKKVVIIGAGPAGLLLAHYLLRRGQYTIDIYERRNLNTLTQTKTNRMFPLSLQERGRKAIRMIPGLEEAIANEGIFCQGSLLYQKQSQPRCLKRKNPILTINRHRLVSIFSEQLTANYPPEQVKMHFDCECIDIDSTAKTVTIQPQEGNNFTVSYDILVGADGVGSRIREYLQVNQGLQCSQHYVRDSYQSICLNRLNRELKIELAADYIHSSNMGNNTRILVVPQTDNKLRGVILFPADSNPLETLSTTTEVIEFFQENFPILGLLISEAEAEILLQRPVSRILSVRCDRLHQGDSILLIGDAAHAVSPAIGQGCNSSLEDVLILSQLLEQYHDNWEQVLPAFSQQRIPDVHALQDLSDYSFPRNKLLITEFFLRLLAGRFLHRYFPRWFQPFVFDLVFDTDMPYSQVLNHHKGWINKVKLSMAEPS